MAQLLNFSNFFSSTSLWQPSLLIRWSLGPKILWNDFTFNHWQNVKYLISKDLRRQCGVYRMRPSHIVNNLNNNTHIKRKGLGCNETEFQTKCLTQYTDWVLKNTNGYWQEREHLFWSEHLKHKRSATHLSGRYTQGQFFTFRMKRTLKLF